jgi:protein SCO1/2
MKALQAAGLAVFALVMIGFVATGDVRAARWGADYIPNLPVVTQDGKTLRFYDDVIKDKIVVVSFLYVSCRDVCPLAAARLAQLQDRLGDRLGRDIFLVSITVDPENDTPAQLKRYAETFGAKPGWLFLTGDPDDIKLIRHRLGERSRFLGEHRNDLMLGNGATGEWQRDSAMGDLERLVMSIEAMTPGRKTAQEITAQAKLQDRAFALTGPPGEPLFRKACAGCHTIGGGDRVGPDLEGVTERRPRDWLIRFIANPAAMRLSKDPIAMDLVARFPVVRMPPLSIPERDAADLISYIEGRSKPPAAASAKKLEALLGLRTHEGKPFAAELVKDRSVAVVFGFTHCPDICPTALLEWSSLLRSLGPEAARMRVLFVTVDPERDTPDVLKAYLSAFDERIIGLTGSLEQVQAAAGAFNAFFEKVTGRDGSITFDHSVKTYLLAPGGQSAGAIDFASEERERIERVRALLAR